MGEALFLENRTLSFRLPGSIRHPYVSQTPRPATYGQVWNVHLPHHSAHEQALGLSSASADMQHLSLSLRLWPCTLWRLAVFSSKDLFPASLPSPEAIAALHGLKYFSIFKVLPSTSHRNLWDDKPSDMKWDEVQAVLLTISANQVTRSSKQDDIKCKNLHQL